MSIHIQWRMMHNGHMMSSREILDDLLAAIVAHETLTTDDGPPRETMTSTELENIAPSKSWTKTMPNDPCAICMEPMKLRRRVKQLPCGHVFCSRCIRRWVVSEHASCPVCRTLLSK